MAMHFHADKGSGSWKSSPFLPVMKAQEVLPTSFLGSWNRLHPWDLCLHELFLVVCKGREIFLIAKGSAMCLRVLIILYPTLTSAAWCAKAVPASSHR